MREIFEITENNFTYYLIVFDTGSGYYTRICKYLKDAINGFHGLIETAKKKWDKK